MVFTRTSLLAKMDTEKSGGTDTMDNDKTDLTEIVKLLRDTVDTLQTTVAELKTALAAKDTRIDELEQRVTKVVQHNVELSSDVAVMKRHVYALEIKIDDQEQYSRKPCLRIEGITKDQGETNESLTTKVVKELNRFGAEVNISDIVRLHRIGRPRTTANGCHVAPQTIVRFRDWGA